MADSNRSRNDDPDDFLASILRKPSPPPKQPAPRHTSTQSTYTHKQRVSGPKVEAIPAKKPRKRLRKGVKRFITALLLAVVLIIGAFLLWSGPISNLLEPKSPFSEEQKQSMGIPLYYPTKLPGSYKIELGSITKPDEGVLMYALSNDNNSRVNITLQKKPEGISLDPLYAVLRDVRDINTKKGVVKYGTSEDGISVANVFVADTWIILNSSPGTLEDNELITIIDSLKH